MKDRFKFRLYDKAISEMVYDVCVGFIKDNCKTNDWVCADTSCGQITYRGDKLKDIVLMQCTGLKDDDDNLIYEGDIIRVFHVSGTMQGEIFFDVVKWNNLRHRFDTENHGIIDEDDVLKVVGNIYENPKLLEEK